MVTVLKSERPKARKDHRCDFCQEKIKKGEIYDNQTCVYDFIYNWKTHIKCTEIAQELNMYEDCDDGLDSDTFCECIKEEYYKLKPKSICKDFKEMLNFVIKKIGKEK